MSDTIRRKTLYSTAAEVRDSIAPLRSQGKKLVTTNGCFDILHAGHVSYLAQAASLGDLLVVGINSDNSVRKLKGAGRPFQPERDRASIMAALAMVDGVFIFAEDDPRAFLEVLQPDVHVKGGDYTRDIIERPVVEKHGGKVVILPFLDGRSTTSLLKKMREQGNC